MADAPPTGGKRRRGASIEHTPAGNNSSNNEEIARAWRVQYEKEVAYSAELKRQMQQEASDHQSALTRLRGRYESQVRGLQSQLSYVKEELEESRETNDDLEMERATLQLNNDELFQRLHQQSAAIVRMQGALDNMRRFGTFSQSTLHESTSMTTTGPSAMALVPTAHCVCCISSTVNACFIPCGHACTCTSCANEIVRRAHDDGKRAACPICRQELGGDAASTWRPNGRSILTPPPFMRLHIITDS